MYRLFVRMIAGNVRARYLAEYVRPQHGERAFDIGCGPGDVLEYLPPMDYVGVDINESYIRAARRRFGALGQFHCQSADNIVVAEPGSFDLVMANGLLHHLNDDECRRLFDVARQALKPSGRLVTFDGCFVPDQSAVARWILRLDRGRFVRTPAEYVQLARSAFGAVDSHVRHDMIRIPYTHHIMVCTRPTAAASGKEQAA